MKITDYIKDLYELAYLQNPVQAEYLITRHINDCIKLAHSYEKERVRLERYYYDNDCDARVHTRVRLDEIKQQIKTLESLLVSLRLK